MLPMHRHGKNTRRKSSYRRRIEKAIPSFVVLILLALLARYYLLYSSLPPDTKPQEETMPAFKQPPPSLTATLPDLSTVSQLSPVSSDVHVVFSTGCERASTEVSILVLQHTLNGIQHTGPVTRIASGCTDKKKETNSKPNVVVFQLSCLFYKILFAQTGGKRY